jgi:hypothetical protein
MGGGSKQTFQHQEIFNFENLGDLVRSVGDCIDGKSQIKFDATVISNLTKDLTENIQSSVNATLKKHTENMMNNQTTNDADSGTQNANSSTQNINSAKQDNIKSDIPVSETNSKLVDTDDNNSQNVEKEYSTKYMTDTINRFSENDIPKTLTYQIVDQDQDTQFLTYKFDIPLSLKDNYIKVEISNQVKNRLAIHFIDNKFDNSNTHETSRHMCYRFYIENVNKILLKSAQSYSDESHVYVKFLKSSNSDKKFKPVAVLYNQVPRYQTYYTHVDN